MKLREKQRQELKEWLIVLESELDANPLLTVQTRSRLLLSSIRLRHYLSTEDQVQ